MRKFILMIIFLIIVPHIGGCNNMKEEEEINLFTLKGIVKNVDEKIEVEVIESDYAFGIYWVITFEETKFINNKGVAITKEDLENEDVIKITYNGQVMMSYPPQIVAYEIELI